MYFCSIYLIKEEYCALLVSSSLVLPHEEVQRLLRHSLAMLNNQEHTHPHRAVIPNSLGFIHPHRTTIPNNSEDTHPAIPNSLGLIHLRRTAILSNQDLTHLRAIILRQGGLHSQSLNHQRLPFRLI